MYPQIANPPAGYGNIPDIPRTRPRGESGGPMVRGHSSDFSHFSSEAWLRLRPGRKKWRGQLQTGVRPENVNIPPLIFLNPHFDLLIWVQTRLILDPGINTRRGNVKSQNFLSFFSRSSKFLSYLSWKFTQQTCVCVDILQSLGTPLEEWSMVYLLVGNSFLSSEFQKNIFDGSLRPVASGGTSH